MNNKIPPPLVALACALVMWVLSVAGAPLSFDFAFQMPLAVSLIFAGFAIDITAALQFRRARTTINPLAPHKASSLVDSGIFSISRNPMYLGMAITLTGIAIWLGNWMSLACVVLFVVYITRFQIMPEEEALATRFGEEFEAYRKRVRRWI